MTKTPDNPEPPMTDDEAHEAFEESGLIGGLEPATPRVEILGTAGAPPTVVVHEEDPPFPGKKSNLPSYLPPVRPKSLVEDLAYRCAVNGGKSVVGFAESMGLSRIEYVDLVADPQFEILLTKFTRAYLELPFHKQLMTRRIENGLVGGLEALNSAIAPTHMRVTETTATTKTIEGPMNELLKGFSASLRSDGRSSLYRQPGGPGSQEDDGVQREVLTPGSEGGSGEGQGAEDA